MSATKSTRMIRPVEETLAAMSDGELIARAYWLADKVPPEVGYQPLQDDLYTVMAEMFERWSPDAAWNQRVADQRESTPNDLGFELEAVRERMVVRAAARVEARYSIAEAVTS